MPLAPEIEELQQFIGFLQPVGLLVAPKALVDQGAVLRADADGLPARLDEVLADDGSVDVVRLLGEVLRWPLNEVLGAPGGPAMPEELRYTVEERGVEHLVPDFAVAGQKPGEPPALLVKVVPTGTDFDETPERGPGWLASPQTKFERLLRHLKAPVGILTDSRRLRLLYAPHGEPSGHGTWTLADLTEPTARPLAAGLHLLLDAKRIVDGQPRFLVELLAKSRDYQNTVSNELSQQVLDALWELLAGFQGSGALKDVPPREAYAGLLKTLMRLVFLLYAEDQDLLPTDPLFRENYSVRGLFTRLERDAGLHPDTMDERYGAWAALLTLFRLVHDGGGNGAVRLPKREGELFNPYRHPFLEGAVGHEHTSGKFPAPKVSDGCIFRVLKKLLIVNEERLSYRTLDVEQIGSVYESMMGFTVDRSEGHVVALQPKDVVVDLDRLLELSDKKRLEHLKNEAEVDLTDKAAKAVRAAETHEELVAAFGKKLSHRTPRPLPPGSYYLQPGYERRRSGSHYTPRALTRPIVEKTLEPLLADLGPHPKPEQILDLKVCDPAMGSGAFLVETCRQLAEKLVAAWKAHGNQPRIPPDETPELYARRLVAQRCLYGVDRNEFAVSLAKLSLWLVTLARDHSFTFIDHALRHGDSLLGLDLQQIADFQWHEPGTGPLFAKYERTIGQAQVLREVIGKGSDDDVTGKLENLKAAEAQIADLRRRGDLLLAAFFGADKDKARQTKRVVYKGIADKGAAGANEAMETLDALRSDAGKPFVPFHWSVEFPEVFGRENGGFDGIVGNPPFIGGTLVGSRLGLRYHDYLVERYPPATGLADLAAFFVRRIFSILNDGGTFGIIATNTVAQGDTRATGLAVILRDGGSIYQAQKRFKWPGEASVVASLLHIRKRGGRIQPSLDGNDVGRVSAFLLCSNADDAPKTLAANRGLCFLGTKIWGAGFVFEETPANGSSSLNEMELIFSKDGRCRDVVFPYIGGEEFNTDPHQSPSRFVIDFGDSTEHEARRWPDLFRIVEERVRPVRATNKQRNYREQWWLHANRVREASPFLDTHGRLLALSAVSPHLSVAFAPRGTVLANSMALFLLSEDHDFAVLQSRLHEAWARFLGSTLEDRLRYTTACFDTFPRPSTERTKALSGIGRRYYDYRAELMKRTQKGLTKTYNRFHDRLERHPEIIELRRLHEEMDRAVLHAYGWDDIPTACDFFPDWPVVSGSEEEEKVPYRFRWPDAVRDEVLGRLLAENQRREGTDEKAAAEEDDEAAPAEEKPTKAAGKKKGGKKAGGEQGTLL